MDEDNTSISTKLGKAPESFLLVFNQTKSFTLPHCRINQEETLYQKLRLGAQGSLVQIYGQINPQIQHEDRISKAVLPFPYQNGHGCSTQKRGRRLMQLPFLFVANIRTN